MGNACAKRSSSTAAMSSSTSLALALASTTPNANVETTSAASALALLASTSAPIQREGADKLFEMSIGSPPRKLEIARAEGAVETLLERASSSDAKIASLSLSVLNNLCDDHPAARVVFQTQPDFVARCLALASSPFADVRYHVFGTLSNLFDVPELGIKVYASEDAPAFVSTALAAVSDPAKIDMCADPAWACFLGLSMWPENRFKLAREPGVVQAATERARSAELVHGGPAFDDGMDRSLTISCRERAAFMLFKLAEHPDNVALLKENPLVVDAARALRRLEKSDFPLALTGQRLLHALGLAGKPRMLISMYTTRIYYPAGDSVALGTYGERSIFEGRDDEIPVPHDWDPFVPDRVEMDGINRVEMRLVSAKVQDL